MTMNIFERATREKLRFTSGIAEITTEQLWDLPLSAKGSAHDLNRIAIATNAELKSIAEVSFVDLKPDPRKDTLELQLEILKYVIADKVAAREAKEKAAERAELKRKLTNVLASKEDQELQSLSADELKAKIAQLS